MAAENSAKTAFQLYDEQWATRYDAMARAGLLGYETIHRIIAAVFLHRLTNSDETDHTSRYSITLWKLGVTIQNQ